MTATRTATTFDPCSPAAYLAAYERHHVAAKAALGLFHSYCRAPLPRVPGCDTAIRLAWRIENGHSVETAAAREYVYRWSIALNASPRNADAVFGVPHTIGL